MSFLIQLLAFIITILVLVTIHEAGHFFMAKWLGIKVIRFSIGFGKPLLRWKDRKGAEYWIAWIPLGGYVKLLDEREQKVTNEELHLAFNRQPLGSRLLVVLAGPVTNLLFALFGFWLMFIIGIDVQKPLIGEVLPHSIAKQAGLKAGTEIVSIDNQPTSSLQKVLMLVIEHLGEKNTLLISTQNKSKTNEKQYQLNLKHWEVDKFNPLPLESLGIRPYLPPLPAVINKLMPGPAADSGLRVGDKIIAIDDIPVKDWYRFVEFIHKNPGKMIRLTYDRNNQILTTRLTIGKKIGLFRQSMGYIGVAPSAPSLPPNLFSKRKYPPIQALMAAFEETKSLFVFNFIILKKIVVGEVSTNSLGGPIAIFENANIAFLQGLTVFLGFLSLISIMLAAINLLPIPGLDGGHLFNYLIELVIRKPVSVRYEVISMQIGIAVLLGIMLLATFNDILRLANEFAW